MKRPRKQDSRAAQRSAKDSAVVPVRLVAVPAELLNNAAAGAAELPELRGPGRPNGALDSRPRSPRVLAVLLMLAQKKTVAEVATALGRPYPTVYAIRERWLHRPGLQLVLPTG